MRVGIASSPMMVGDAHPTRLLRKVEGVRGGARGYGDGSYGLTMGRGFCAPWALKKGKTAGVLQQGGSRSTGKPRVAVAGCCKSRGFCNENP